LILLDFPNFPPHLFTELRQQAAAAFLAWHAGQTSKNK